MTKHPKEQISSMSKTQKFILAICVAAIAAFGASASASAAITFELDQRVEGGSTYATAFDLDTTKQSTLRQMRAGVEFDRSNYPSGSNYNELYTTLLAGDVMEIYQYPAADPVLPAIPLIPPVRSIVVPSFTVNAVAGSPVVSGSIADEWSVWVTSYNECTNDGGTLPATRAAGTYSATLPRALAPQSYYSVAGRLANGDRIRLMGELPGDAACIDIDAAKGTSGYGLPYEVEVDGLDSAVAPTTRVRLLRGGALIAEANNDELDLTEAQKPLPGDVIEVYRPQGAPAPAYVVTIPPTSGVFDPGNDLVAIDSQAGEYIDAMVCRPVTCDESYDNQRTSRSVPGGRTLFDFASGLGPARPYNIFAGDLVIGRWLSPEGKLRYEFELTQGDLTSPVGSVKLAKKLKAKSINKKLKFKLTSNEAGKLNAKLTLPAKKKGKKPATLASGKSNVKAGSNTISLKTTSGGKKALKKIAKGKKSVGATLTLTLTDASGNVTTIVKGTKLK